MHRRRALMIFAGFGLCPLCASIGFAAEESHHWSYEGPTGPETWGGLDAADAPCSAGDQQSPIDITGAISARQPPLKLSWSKRPDTIVNNGHTIQLNFAGGNTLRVGDRSYGLTQFHCHHPSEHRVDGKGVCHGSALCPCRRERRSRSPRRVHRSGQDRCRVQQHRLDNVGGRGPPVAADPAIDPNRLLPPERTFYHYEGSLTTPPCSQTVDWLVLAHPSEAAEAYCPLRETLPDERSSRAKRRRRFILTSGLR